MPIQNFIFQVSDDADDIAEISGALDAGDSPYYLGNRGEAPGWQGVRFLGVSLPQGSIINEALFQIQAAFTQWSILGLTIYGDDADNSAAWSDPTRPSQRSLTTASFAYAQDEQWGGLAWSTIADIKDIVQEIVDRPGWQAGNALSVVVRGNVNGGTEFQRKLILAHEDGASVAPRILIEAEVPEVVQGNGTTVLDILRIVREGSKTHA